MATQRATAALDLLRALWAVVSAYRLYPGDLQQPGFRHAAERVRAAANVATAARSLHVEVRGAQLFVRGEPVPDDPGLDALAHACFERRVEHLQVLRPPEPRELAAVAAVLSHRPDELEAAGGIPVLLHRAGVRSLSLGELAPDANLHDDVVGLDPGQRELWDVVSDPERFVATLLVQGLPTDVADAAQRIHRRLAVIHAGLPAELVGRGALFHHVGRILELLPIGVRDELLAIAVTQLGTDEFSTELLHNLTDQQLATWLVELGAARGPDPVDLAERVVAGTERQTGLTEIVRAELDLVAGLSASRPTMVALTRPRTGTDQVPSAIADALGRRLLEQRDRDVAGLRGAFPAGRADERALAVAALRDYLRAEEDTDRAHAVLRTWADAVRRSAQAGALDELAELLDTVAAPLAEADQRKALSLRQGIATVLDHELLARLLESGRDEQDAGHLRTLVDVLGGPGVDGLLDALGEEQDRGLRSQLVALLGELAPHHLDRIAARLGDPRWYVARNVVTILGRSSHRDALPVLVAHLDHREPAVRRELVRALVGVGGPDAVPWLRRLAVDPEATVRAAAVASLAGLTTDSAAAALADIVREADDVADRRQALERLAAHLAPAAPTLLRDLASRGTGPRLPRGLRKLARGAAKRLEGQR